jgi:hypothetical protein
MYQVNEDISSPKGNSSNKSVYVCVALSCYGAKSTCFFGILAKRFLKMPFQRNDS